MMIQITGPKSVVTNLQFSLDSKVLLVQGESLQIVDVKSGDLIGSTGQLQGRARFTPNGKSLLVSDGDDGWEYRCDFTLKKATRFEFPEGEPPNGLWLLKDEKKLLTYGWSSDEDLPVVELRGGRNWKVEKTWNLFETEEDKYHEILVTHDDLFFFGVNNTLVRCHSLRDGKVVWTYPFAKSLARLTSVQFRPKHFQLLVGDEKQVTILDQESGEEVFHHQSKKSPLKSTFTADGKRLAILLKGAETASFLDVESNETVDELASPEGKFTAIAFSPDGKKLAVACSSKKTFLLDTK